MKVILLSKISIFFKSFRIKPFVGTLIFNYGTHEATNGFPRRNMEWHDVRKNTLSRGMTFYSRHGARLSEVLLDIYCQS